LRQRRCCALNPREPRAGVDEDARATAVVRSAAVPGRGARAAARATWASNRCDDGASCAARGRGRLRVLRRRRRILGAQDGCGADRAVAIVDLPLRCVRHLSPPAATGTAPCRLACLRIARLDREPSLRRPGCAVRERTGRVGAQGAPAACTPTGASAAAALAAPTRPARPDVRRSAFSRGALCSRAG
jgi:hypothetical protein